MSKVTKATTKKPLKESLSTLIESELEKAEIVLSAKSVTDKVSKMASDLTKIEADDILPMLDTLVAAFGPDLADQFKNIAVTNLRQAAEAVTASKTAIDAELAKLEAILNGEPAPEVEPAIASPVKNDMATGGGLPSPDGSADDGSADDGLGDNSDDNSDEDGSEVPPDFSDDADMDSSFAGRPRKESVERRGRLIAEAELRAAGSDAVVLRAFRSMVKEGASGPLAARSVARHYGIDVSDVVDIVKEAFEAGKRFPVMHNSLMSKNSKRVNEAAKKDKDVPEKHQERICRDTVKNPNKSFLGGPSAAEAEKTLRSKFGYDDKKIKKLKEDAVPAETLQPPNPSDVQKAKTLATKIKATAPGGTVPLNRVGTDIEKNIGAVGKSASDIGAMSPLVTKELDSMGAIKEGDQEAASAGRQLFGKSARMFKDIGVGEKFKFPKSDEVLTKIAGGFKDSKGRKFKTGARTSVLPHTTEIQEGNEESPVGDTGHDAFASWLDNRHNTLMSKVMGGTVDEECEVSPVAKPSDIDMERKNEMFSKSDRHSSKPSKRDTLPGKEVEEEAEKPRKMRSGDSTHAGNKKGRSEHPWYTEKMPPAPAKRMPPSQGSGTSGAGRFAEIDDNTLRSSANKPKR